MQNRLFHLDAAVRYRLGTALVWLGVLIWVPFIVLILIGRRSSVFWYLPFHLIGVVGGSSLRKAAREALGLPKPARNLLRLAGQLSIALGIAAWGPYFYNRLVLQLPVDAAGTVPYHLAGVLTGVFLLVLAARKVRKTG